MREKTQTCFENLWEANMKDRNAAYLNPELSIGERLADLMRRMTLEEKVGQMCQYLLPPEGGPPTSASTAPTDDTDDSTMRYDQASRRSVPELIERGLIGSLLSETDPERLNAAQRLAANSRLGIPLILGIDAIHGVAMHRGATVYPAPIGLAATWDTELVQRVARATAQEMRALNLHWTFSPNVDVLRDGRWGRAGECFGEDPYLVSEMGRAMVRGYQGDLSHGDVVACAKHYIAGGEPANGLNFCAMDLSERGLREVFLPPFAASVREGVGTVMAAHNEVNGVPCHGNRYLLTEVLRNELGFEGFVVSDFTDVPRLYTLHRVATSVKDADRQAVQAGIDMHMHGPGFLDEVCELVREGTIDEMRIDAAIRPVLECKFRLGLFEQRTVDVTKVHTQLATDGHVALALEAARKSIVLLRNEGDLLPLARDGGPILVTGPSAHAQTILGDWCVEQPDENVVTVLDGIRAQASAETEVHYYDCGDLLEIGDRQIEEARTRAAQAAVAVVVVGENPLRDQESKTEGENVARTDLDLPGRQLELVQAIAASGTPTVVVLVNGRPQSVPWIAEHAPALLEAFHPGMMGGQALAEVLFGATNPGGRLPYTVPCTVGQLRAVYNHRPADYFRHYRLTPNEPLYPFGHGLSYTTFDYFGLQVPETIRIGENVPVRVTVANTGSRAGDEVVILYLHDAYSSVTTPVRQVVAFGRLHLLPGEAQTLTLHIQADQLALYDQHMRRAIEPGTFEVYAGDQTASFEAIA
jgi:beta-glucosidase